MHPVVSADQDEVGAEVLEHPVMLIFLWVRGSNAMRRVAIYDVARRGERIRKEGKVR